MNSLIEKLAQGVQQESISEGSHDWWHVWRVWQLARKIARAEGADVELVELAALCHDLEDWKYAHAPRIEPILGELGLPPARTQQVLEICQRVSFKGAGVADEMPTLEGQVVQDADRLDAIGAIGIARCFAFGGARSRSLYDPADPPELHSTVEAYQSKSGSSLNHFYEKLLLLKDRMHTPSARALAQQRHAYMEGFVQEFLAEWEGMG